MAAVGLDTLLAGATVACEAMQTLRGSEVSRILDDDFSTASPRTAPYAWPPITGRLRLDPPQARLVLPLPAARCDPWSSGSTRTRATASWTPRPAPPTRAAGVSVNRVLTSQWYRSPDKARFLGLGPVEDLVAFNSFFRNPARADRLTDALRRFLFGLSPGETVVLITHYVNIMALTGLPVASGEVLLLEIDRDGTLSFGRSDFHLPPALRSAPAQTEHLRICFNCRSACRVIHSTCRVRSGIGQNPAICCGSGGYHSR